MEESVKYLKALVLLQLQAVTGSALGAKPEVLLAKAGLPRKEIAELLGKTEAAVAKAISRAKSAPSGADDEQQDD